MHSFHKPLHFNPAFQLLRLFLQGPLIIFNNDNLITERSIEMIMKWYNAKHGALHNGHVLVY